MSICNELNQINHRKIENRKVEIRERNDLEEEKLILVYTQITRHLLPDDTPGRKNKKNVELLVLSAQ